MLLHLLNSWWCKSQLPSWLPETNSPTVEVIVVHIRRIIQWLSVPSHEQHIIEGDLSVGFPYRWRNCSVGRGNVDWTRACACVESGGYAWAKVLHIYFFNREGNSEALAAGLISKIHRRLMWDSRRGTFRVLLRCRRTLQYRGSSRAPPGVRICLLWSLGPPCSVPLYVFRQLTTHEIAFY